MRNTINKIASVERKISRLQESLSDTVSEHRNLTNTLSGLNGVHEAQSAEPVAEIDEHKEAA